MLVDPENPPRAVDGGRMPAASTFADFVRFLEDGQLDSSLSDELKRLASDMSATAIESGGKAKGKMTLTLDFALEGRVFTIRAKHKVDVPEAKRPNSVMWSTTDGRFTPSNPQQGNLFGVRDVASPRMRDAI